MATYTKEDFQNAYKVGATEIANRLAKAAYDFAKYNPGCATYSERIHIDRLVAETALSLLKTDILRNELLGIQLTMTFNPDKFGESCNRGFAIFTFDWS